MNALFAYGTLIDLDFFRAVTGADCDRVSARLAGYARYPVRGADYPGIRPAAGCAVDGVVYLGVTEMAWQRLDAYEGDEYERVRVRVTMQADDKVCEVYAYVFKAEYVDRLERDR